MIINFISLGDLQNFKYTRNPILTKKKSNITKEKSIKFENNKANHKKLVK